MRSKLMMMHQADQAHQVVMEDSLMEVVVSQAVLPAQRIFSTPEHNFHHRPRRKDPSIASSPGGVAALVRGWSNFQCRTIRLFFDSKGGVFASSVLLKMGSLRYFLFTPSKCCNDKKKCSNEAESEKLNLLAHFDATRNSWHVDVIKHVDFMTMT